MTRIEALEQAKANGYKKAILTAYTYHARTIDSHIGEAERAIKDPDYKGSSAETDDRHCAIDGEYITRAGEVIYVLVK